MSVKITKDRTSELIDEIRRRMHKGIQAGIEYERDQLKNKYSLNQSPPPSNPGEYLAEDSGQLVDNIAAHMSDSSIDPLGGVGVYGKSTPRPFRGNRFDPDNIGGLHAYYHSHGSGFNPYTVLGLRKGIDDSFSEDRSEIASEIERAAK